MSMFLNANWMNETNNIPQWQNWIFFVIAAGGLIVTILAWLITSRIVNNRRFPGGYDQLENFSDQNALQLGGGLNALTGAQGYIGNTMYLDQNRQAGFIGQGAPQPANTPIDQRLANNSANNFAMPSSQGGMNPDANVIDTNTSFAGSNVIDASQFEDKKTPFGSTSDFSNNMFAGSNSSSTNNPTSDFNDPFSSFDNQMNQSQNASNQQKPVFSPFEMPFNNNDEKSKGPGRPSGTKKDKSPSDQINMTLEDRTGKKLFKASPGRPKKN